MRELGNLNQSEHEAFAHYISGLDVKKYYLVGQSMKEFVVPILEKAGKDVVWKKSSREIA